mgnify:CR=1 FL=1
MPEMTWLWVAFGSAIGGVGRYWTGSALALRYGDSFPWGTLMVNVVGSLLIGLIATLALPEGRLLMDSTTRQFLMIGVLGGFTTFSSFSLQSLTLMQDGEWVAAGAYVLGSVFLCLLGVWLGQLLGVTLNR